MAYASKELKVKVLDKIKATAKEMGVEIKATAKILSGTTLVVNIQACSVDLQASNLETLEQKLQEKSIVGFDKEDIEFAYDRNKNFNPVQNIKYRGEGLVICRKLENCFSGQALEIMQMIEKEMNCDNYNKSDAKNDYYDYGYYTRIKLADNKGGFKLL